MCNEKPIAFKRGSTFSFMFQVPANIPDGFFSGWLPTAQLRKAKNDLPNGLIADMECYWNTEVTARHIIVRNTLTDNWPLGVMDLDIRLNSVNGETIMTQTQQFNIIRGVSR
jgi:hypothetical protein